MPTDQSSLGPSEIGGTRLGLGVPEAGRGGPRSLWARRVQLVRRDGRDVSTLYRREGGGRGQPPRGPRPARSGRATPATPGGTCASFPRPKSPTPSGRGRSGRSPAGAPNESARRSCAAGPGRNPGGKEADSFNPPQRCFGRNLYENRHSGMRNNRHCNRRQRNNRHSGMRKNHSRMD